MKGKKEVAIYLQSTAKINPAINRVEIRSMPEARADLVVNQVRVAWLSKDPILSKVIVYRHKDLLAELKTMVANDYRKS